MGGLYGLIITNKRGNIITVGVDRRLVPPQLYSNTLVTEKFSWAHKIVTFCYNKHIKYFGFPKEERVLFWKSEQFIAFKVVENLIFYVIASSTEFGELGLSTVMESFLQGCKTICKKMPEDEESILRYYYKINTMMDDLILDSGLFSEKFTKGYSEESGKNTLKKQRKSIYLPTN